MEKYDENLVPKKNFMHERFREIKQGTGEFL